MSEDQFIQATVPFTQRKIATACSPVDYVETKIIKGLMSYINPRNDLA